MTRTGLSAPRFQHAKILLLYFSTIHEYTEKRYVLLSMGINSTQYTQKKTDVKYLSVKC